MSEENIEKISEIRLMGINEFFYGRISIESLIEKLQKLPVGCYMKYSPILDMLAIYRMETHSETKARIETQEGTKRHNQYLGLKKEFENE